jgi:tetratricopeptide (TPR) repeat protein/nucleoside phosphorylase
MSRKSASQHRTRTINRPADFVIITALEEERDVVLSNLGRMNRLDKEPMDAHTYYRGSVKSTRKDGSMYDVVVTCLLGMGPTDTATRAAQIVKRWNPTYVLLVGIACGVRGEAEHGDILLATQVADYTLGKQQSGRRKIRWNVTPCGASLLDSAINVSSKWQRSITAPRPGDGEPKLRKGVVASGGDVIADDRIVAAYSAIWPKLVGIEMEAGGVAAALHQTVERPEFLMIKGVSDLGADKHDPRVLPWRSYACHAAAAFTRALIESGPSAKLEELGGDEEEEIRSAERRWSYLQRSPLRGLKVLLILKASVGQDWLRSILDETRVRFSRDKDAFAVGTAFALSAQPNTKEDSPRWDEVVCAFWKKYEADPSLWVRRINRHLVEHSVVAGFDASIPWATLNLPSVTALGDLGQLSDIGMSLPPEAFMAGVEEYKLTFVGDQFSFSLKLSDHGLEMLHEMASVHFQLSTPDKSVPLNLGTGFNGIQLLEMFREQLLPAWRRKENRPGSIFGGRAGPDGKAISFYPNMPSDFDKSDEAKEYTFKITAPDTERAKARIRELEAAVANGSVDAEIYGELAARYANGGRLLDAIRYLEQGIGKVQPNVGLYGLLGESLDKLGRHEEALVQFLEGEKIQPEHAGVQSAIGICLARLGNDKAALERLQAAARLEPSEARHHANLGRSLAQQERYVEAAASYERALALSPNDVSNLELLGVLYVEIGRPHDAERCFSSAVEVAPNSPEAHENLGRYLASIGQHERAIPILQRAMEIEESARRHELLGGSYADQLCWPEAEASFRRAATLEPDNIQHFQNLGICIMNQGRFKEALAVFESELQKSPGNKELVEFIEEARQHIAARAE